MQKKNHKYAKIDSLVVLLNMKFAKNWHSSYSNTQKKKNTIEKTLKQSYENRSDLRERIK